MNGLLADADLIQFIAMVVVLSLVAVSTWIRKTMEKWQQREGGKPIDVGKAVRAQLDKYMRAAGQLPPEQPAPPAQPPPVATRPPPPEAVRDRTAPAPKPAVVVAARKPPGQFRPLSARSGQVKKTHRVSKFSPQDVKRAVVHAELLGPPMAMRKDYRLF